MKKTPLEQLKECVAIQCDNGNWNYSPYMHGFANGLLFAEALLEDRSPEYLNAPEEWLKDKPMSETWAAKSSHKAPHLSTGEKK